MSLEKLSGTLTLKNGGEANFSPTEETVVAAGAFALRLFLVHQGVPLTAGSPTLDMDPALLELLAETANNADAIKQAPNN